MNSRDILGAWTEVRQNLRKRWDELSMKDSEGVRVRLAGLRRRIRRIRRATRKQVSNRLRRLVRAVRPPVDEVRAAPPETVRVVPTEVPPAEIHSRP